MFKMMLCVLLLFISDNFAQETDKSGSLTGRVIDNENKMPLPGVNVYLKNMNTGSATDINGNYKIEKLPVGNYVVVYSFIGYIPVSVPDIIVRSGRITYQDVELQSSSVEFDSVVVSGGYFSEAENKPVSTIQFSSEEIRRAPGSVGDVSRILFGLPSVAKINDGKSSFMVRGGSPVENSFYLDNIEINNINHFSTQGSTDGFFGMLNIDFVKNVTFNAGGFSPLYGDKLSSVMEINFREGNRTEYDGQINLNFGGIGGQIEGPFANKKGSFLFSANKSYLDMMMKVFAEGYPSPEYYDAQTKIVYDISENHKLTFLDIFANDVYNIPYDKAVDKEMNQYGNTKIITNTAGLNWMYIWGQNGYSNTSLSNTINSRNVFLNETKSQNMFLSNNTNENTFALRNINYYKLNDEHKFEFGVESKFGLNKFNYTFFEYQDEYGNVQPTVEVADNLNTISAGTFLMYHSSIVKDISLSLGGRIDYFDYTDKLLYSPRGVLSYKFSPSTSISASAGIYYQNIPSLVLAQSDEFKKLKTPVAIHYVLSLSHMLTEETRLTVEVYEKDYSNLPVDPAQSKDFLFDQVVTTGLFTNHSNLLSSGKALSRGVEVMIQKKLAMNFYGMISASYSKAEYKDLNGVRRNRIFDNRFNFNVEGGYKPNNEWEFSCRFVYAGGAPFTPFDMQLSQQYNKGILNLENINTYRLPDYHSLNLRVDKRFYFDKTNLVVFFSVWNVYNRDNISAYTWNEVKNKIAKEVGWNTLPVFGIEYEF